MTRALERNMMKALKRLEYECSYEDDRVGDEKTFILLYKLAPGIGMKTIEALLERGLIVAGENRWFQKVGYRITDAGRTVLQRGRI